MSDRYYKHFKTSDHLTTMIFATLCGSSSLREVSSIMLACEGKINHLGLSKTRNAVRCPMRTKNIQAAYLPLSINPSIISTSIFIGQQSQNTSTEGFKDRRFIHHQLI
jgi:hypothetical protein